MPGEASQATQTLDPAAHCQRPTATLSLPMSESWQVRDTTTHQDHVIAHVVGATVLGYWVLDEVLYILLDIGFVWIVFLDGQMTLLPHPVAVSELDIPDEARNEIKADIDLMLGDNTSVETLSRLKLPPLSCRNDSCKITEVDFFDWDDRRRLVVHGEHGSLSVETSLSTAEIRVYECRG